MSRCHTSLALCLLLVAGCGSDSTSAPAAADDAQIGAGLQAGEFQLEFSGSLLDAGPWPGDQPQVHVRPHVYREQAPRANFAGRQRVEPNDADGPYRVSIRRLIQRDGGEVRQAHIDIQLPPAARAGGTYVVRGRTFAEHGEAYAEIRAPGRGGWRENGNIGQPPILGEIRLGQTDGALTASFALQIADTSDHPRHALIQGSVFRIPIESLASVEARTLRVPPPETR
ncbi:MAG: hypothetical protein ACXIUM_09820 [Wenzhouxiangella sp.]